MILNQINFIKLKQYVQFILSQPETTIEILSL